MWFWKRKKQNGNTITKETVIFKDSLYHYVFHTSIVKPRNKFWIITDEIFSEEQTIQELSQNNNYQKHGFSIFEWLIRNNEYVNKDQPIALIQIGSSRKHEKYSNKVYQLSGPILAPESGLLSHNYDEKSEIAEGDIIFSINPDSSQVMNKNAPFNYYFNWFDIPLELRQFTDNPLHPCDNSVYPIELLSKEGQYVERGTPVIQIGCQAALDTLFKFEIPASINGYISYRKEIPFEFPHIYGKILQKEHLFTIYPDKTSKYYNKPIISIDDFTKEKSIRWEVVGGLERPFNSIEYSPIGAIHSISYDNQSFLFSFYNLDGKDFIVFNFFSNELKLSVKDKISFLFENGEIITFDILEKPYKLKSYWKHLFETKTQIAVPELELFKKVNISKWKVEFSNNSISIEGSSGNEWYPGDNFPKTIRNFAIEYCSLVECEIKDYRPINDGFENNLQQPLTENCYVYLMEDITNNYQKIGISNNPEYREHTLQSEKPTIELICKKEFPNRKIAESIEKALHDTYAEKRIRGEWFDLTDNDIDDIKKTLT